MIRPIVVALLTASVLLSGCQTGGMGSVTQAHIYDVHVGDCVELPDADVFVVQGNESLHIFTAPDGEWDCTNAQAVAAHDTRQRIEDGGSE